MFKSIREKFRKPCIPVYLGEVTIAPRSNFKRLLEFGWESNSTDEELRKWILELLEIPLFEDNATPENGYIMDVIVTKYQCGSDAGMWSEPLLPLFWRPSVTIGGRLRTRDGKVLCTCQAKKSMPWRQFILNTMNPLNWYRPRSAVNVNDMKMLLAQSLLEVLDVVKKAA